MASGWTNKYAILRDLSVAQGRGVPVEIKNTVAEDEKPPALNYTEETEEEFFENCVSNGDFSTGPDITLIQQMLDMVRESNVTDIDEVGTNTILEISKVPWQRGSGDESQMPEIRTESEETKQKEKNKPKQRKNVAVASLIAAYGENSQNEVPDILKLTKPNNDVVSENENNTQAIQNNRSLKTIRSPTQREKDINSVVSPTFMFKKKSPNQKIAEGYLQQPSSSPISVQSDCVSPVEPIKPGSFVPSSHAGEYYKKYVERSEMQAEVKEDIWSRAERKMKEIEHKRIKESTSPRRDQESSKTPELQEGYLQQPSSSPISVQSDCVSPVEPIKPGSFVPSSHAGEYYKKYVERSEMQAEVKEDIWSRAERKMKEIEHKRIKESTSPRRDQESSKTPELQDVDNIRLP